MQIIHLFEQKLVYINNNDVKDEMLSFPFGDHDDYVDSSVYALYWLMMFQQGAVIRNVSKAKEFLEKARSNSLFLKRNNKTGAYTMVAEPIKPKTISNFINADK